METREPSWSSLEYEPSTASYEERLAALTIVI